MNKLNRYGDHLIENDGKGADIASQRIDTLDSMCIEYVKSLVIDNNSILIADAGTGRCAQANRISNINKTIKVHAIDNINFSDHADENVIFVHDDIIKHFTSSSSAQYDAIYCQRTIHYLDYQSALILLSQMHRSSKPGAKLFISASGNGSELSENYPGKSLEISSRYDFLSEKMQNKHGIRERVCLYDLDDLISSIEKSGWKCMSADVSEFGNIKLIANER